MKRRLTVFRSSGVESDAQQRYQQYIEYRRGRQDGRLGHPRAGLSPAYLLGFELGRKDAVRLDEWGAIHRA